MNIEQRPGNIPSQKSPTLSTLTNPKVQAEVDVKGTASSPETQAASQAASAQITLQNANNLQRYLENTVGEPVATTTMTNIAAALKNGKQLSFDVIKQATFDATESIHGAEAAKTLKSEFDAEESKVNTTNTTTSSTRTTTPTIVSTSTATVAFNITETETESQKNTTSTPTPSKPSHSKSTDRDYTPNYNPLKYLQNIAAFFKQYGELKEAMTDLLENQKLEADIKLKFEIKDSNFKQRVQEEYLDRPFAIKNKSV